MRCEIERVIHLQCNQQLQSAAVRRQPDPAVCSGRGWTSPAPEFLHNCSPSLCGVPLGNGPARTEMCLEVLPCIVARFSLHTRRNHESRPLLSVIRAEQQQQQRHTRSVCGRRGSPIQSICVVVDGRDDVPSSCADAKRSTNTGGGRTRTAAAAAHRAYKSHINHSEADTHAHTHSHTTPPPPPRDATTTDEERESGRESTGDTNYTTQMQTIHTTPTLMVLMVGTTAASLPAVFDARASGCRVDVGLKSQAVAKLPGSVWTGLWCGLFVSNKTRSRDAHKAKHLHAGTLVAEQHTTERLRRRTKWTVDNNTAMFANRRRRTESGTVIGIDAIVAVF